GAVSTNFNPPGNRKSFTHDGNWNESQSGKSGDWPLSCSVFRKLWPCGVEVKIADPWRSARAGSMNCSHTDLGIRLPSAMTTNDKPSPSSDLSGFSADLTHTSQPHSVEKAILPPGPLV